MAEPPSGAFHRRGHHVQKAHGRRVSLAADTSHRSGGMIALMPTAADAKRLALKGGEAAAELHCTLFFLGDDGSIWTEDQRDELEALVRSRAEQLPPLKANVFGVAHWNGNAEKPSWVWSVGDNPDAELADSSLHEAQMIVTDALESTHERPEIPHQHTPWVAHICAAYTDDLTLVRELEKRLGPVTFDRIRLSFGDDDRDIPLEGTAVSLTAAGFRRNILPHEEGTDFAEHNRQWENAVTSTANRLNTELAGWRAQVRDQIIAGADTPEELAGITVDTGDASGILREAMTGLAERAGQSLQREAERQGVEIPEWSLPDDAVTAAVGGRRLLDSVARMTTDLMATSVIQTAKRVVTGLFTQDASPETLAAEVDRVLTEGQDGLIKSQIGTAMSTAQTAGRQAVLEAAPPGEYYASEVLDRNTCFPCKAVDGEQFGDLERAIKAYPVMGYKDCVGPRYGNSCRGMIVARWMSEEPVTAALLAHGDKSNPGYPLMHPGDLERTEKRGELITDGNKVDKQPPDPLTYYRTPPPDDPADEPPDLDEYYDEHGEEWRPQSEIDLDRFADYSSDGWSDPVSHRLRTGEGDPDEIYEDQEIDDMIASMDRIASQYTLDRPVSVYRVAPAEHYDVPDGGKVKDDAFMSTTVYRQVTKKYKTGDDDVLMRIDMPAGMHIIPHRHLNGHSSAKGEVILPRGMTLERKGEDEDGVAVFVPVYSSRGAEDIEDDPTSSVLDDEAQTASAVTMPPGTQMIGEGSMPWHVEHGHTECGDGRWAVVKDADGSVAGCHDSQADADTQLAALYASEGDATMTTEALKKGDPNQGTKKDKRLKENMYAGDEAEALEVQGPEPADIGGEQTAPWRGPLTVEGVETGDGREFDNESLTWADLPLPLRWNKEDSHGGDPKTVAVNVGRIDKIWREDSGLIMGEGLLDLSDDDGRKVHGKIKGKFLRGVSVDVDSVKGADMELIWPDQPDGEGDDPDPFAQLFAEPEKVVFHKGRIRAATLVDIPAFAEAYIALLDESGAVTAGGEPIGALRASRAPRHRSFAVDVPVRPPVDWFRNPDLSVPTGITVTADGRVYGHAALWGTCHIGQAGVCVTPPREDDHPYFMTGNVWVEDESSVSVGQITVGTNHAPLSYNHRAASDHYDNTGAAVADVAVGNDAHGIWVAGSIRPGASAARIHELRAAGQVSGDWRRIGGSLRLVGLLAVNVPGFPVPKLGSYLVEGQQLALVASGIPALTDTMSEAELDQWAFKRVMSTLARRVNPEE